MPARYSGGPTINGAQKTPPLLVINRNNGVSFGGSYRDRTDDIHGVNVALYQLS